MINLRDTIRKGAIVSILSRQLQNKSKVSWKLCLFEFMFSKMTESDSKPV